MENEPYIMAAQGETVSLLMDQAASGSLAHATLISGLKGTGKRTLARMIAAAILCQASSGKPCGRCQACLQVEKEEHPDLILIRKGLPIAPDVKKDRATIPVDDIREMIRRISVHAYEGNIRIVIIENGEDMTPQAQNSLLKTLEEPPAGTFLLITSNQPEVLLPTIISRCRPVKIRPWGDEIILRVLLDRGIAPEEAQQAARAADGSPGEAIRLAEDEASRLFRSEVIRDFFETSLRSDVMNVVGRWKDRKAEVEPLLAMLDRMIEGMMRRNLRLSGAEGEVSDLPDSWLRFADGASPEDISHLMEGVSSARRRILSSVHFQTVLEQLLFLLMEAVHPWLM